MALFIPPKPQAVLGAYQRCVTHNSIAFLSGQFALRDGKILHPGRLGSELSDEQAAEAIKQSAENVFAAIYHETEALKHFERLLCVDAFIACSNGYSNHAALLDVASNQLLKRFGAAGEHARTLMPVSSLPLNSCVELKVTFAVTVSK